MFIGLKKRRRFLSLRKAHAGLMCLFTESWIRKRVLIFPRVCVQLAVKREGLCSVRLLPKISLRSSTEITISELILIGGPIPLLLTNVVSVLAQTP
jgi:hypothetical protein